MSEVSKSVNVWILSKLLSDMSEWAEWVRKVDKVGWLVRKWVSQWMIWLNLFGKWVRYVKEVSEC